jgi:1,4-alpha-glucan branching enzyme
VNVFHFILILAITGFTTARAQPPQPAALAPRETETGVVFQCYAPEATRVFLAGDFNAFARNRGGRITDRQFALSGPDSNGVFSTTVRLPPGLYRYKFALETDTFIWFAPDYEFQRDADSNAFLVVDGVVDDTKRPAARGAVVEDDSVWFEVFAPHADMVYLAGSFNQWAKNQNGQVTDLRYAMRGPDDNGIWRAQIALPRGRHAYQFVINGREWISDPMAAETTTNRHSIVEVLR